MHRDVSDTDQRTENLCQSALAWHGPPEESVARVLPVGLQGLEVVTQMRLVPVYSAAALELGSQDLREGLGVKVLREHPQPALDLLNEILGIAKVTVRAPLTLVHHEGERPEAKLSTVLKRNHAALCGDLSTIHEDRPRPSSKAAKRQHRPLLVRGVVPKLHVRRIEREVLRASIPRTERNVAIPTHRKSRLPFWKAHKPEWASVWRPRGREAHQASHTLWRLPGFNPKVGQARHTRWRVLLRRSDNSWELSYVSRAVVEVRELLSG